MTPRRARALMTPRQYQRWRTGNRKQRLAMERESERHAREAARRARDISAPVVVAEIFAERARPVRHREPSRARWHRGPTVNCQQKYK
jgi:hypothetical protein